LKFKSSGYSKCVSKVCFVLFFHQTRRF